MATRFRLDVGEAAPRQQSPTTCGSACLLVARMLLDPTFAEVLLDGSGSGRPGHAAWPATAEADARFAAHERLVAARTNALVARAGGVQLPWPRALGTPPWGARAELQRTGASPGGSYSVRWLRLRGTGVLERTYAALLASVSPGRPALLYVGNQWLPRHVVLLVPGEPHLLVYEPSAGRVLDLPAGPFVRRELGLAGWDVPWAAVWDRAVT